MISVGTLHWLLHGIEIKHISLMQYVMSNGKKVEQRIDYQN
jgi:hypothetical protein